MLTSMSSRDRLLSALGCAQVDHVPCCFGSFQILQKQCANQAEYLDRQLGLGLDVIARIAVLEPRHSPRVQIREWSENLPGSPYHHLLHKRYKTPVGTLETSVETSEDWPWGNHIPFNDDFLIPRSSKMLVTPSDNLEPLRYLLAPPADEEIAQFRDRARHVKVLASERNLLTVGTYSTVGDMAAWLCGIQQLIMLTVDNPEFVRQVLYIIEEWNRRQMTLVLEEGVDLVIRRAWYENADSWSPAQYRRFILPSLSRDVELAHQAGARFGYLMSYASMPLIDMMIEAGVDVLLGIDPAQDRLMDLKLLKQKVSGKMCVWGGVCGYLTIELGTSTDIETEVKNAITTLSPGGGFILAPVTNVRADTHQAWENVRTMIESWHRLR